jgi:hypothetical protein
MQVFVFIYFGSFPSVDQALSYTQGCWEPDPPDSVSDAEYEAWEDRNPVWPLREELDVYLDSDFIETIVEPDWQSYLKSLIRDPDQLHTIMERCPENTNCLVLIYEAALGGYDSVMKSTSKLTLIGKYPCTL